MTNAFIAATLSGLVLQTARRWHQHAHDIARRLRMAYWVASRKGRTLAKNGSCVRFSDVPVVANFGTYGNHW